GALYLILQNRLYRGEIVHKDRNYPGEHDAIIEPALWDAVQARLAENGVERVTGIRVKNPTLLAGLLFDGEGHDPHPCGQERQALPLLRLPPADHRRAGRWRRWAADPSGRDRAGRRKSDPPAAPGAGKPFRDHQDTGW